MPIISLPLTATLTNGNTADAGQVTADLLQIASNVNSNAAANGVNSDITSLTALTSITSALTVTGWSINTPVITGGTMTSTALTGVTIDGTSTGVTQALGTSNTTLCTMAALAAQSFTTALPAQTGNAGKAVITDGTTASWGVLSAIGGGTGQSSYAVGDLLYASTTTALSKRAAVATGQVLLSQGVGVAPIYSLIGTSLQPIRVNSAGTALEGYVITPNVGATLYLASTQGGF